jgi:hypothetical protein
MNSHNAGTRARRLVVTRVVACAIIAATLSCRASAQAPNTGPVHQEQLSIGGISFSCPNGFGPQQTDSSYQVVYMRHNREELALFVAIPRSGSGDEYVDHLGSFLTTYLFPAEWAVFACKHLDWYQRGSKFETGGGRIRIFNGAQAVLLEYRHLQVSGKEVIVGFLAGAGRDEHAADALGSSPSGGSAAGRDAERLLIASITGEKYDDLTSAGDTTPGSKAGRTGVDIDRKALAEIKGIVQATISRFRRDKVDPPVNFSLALTLSSEDNAGRRSVTVAESSGSKEIDEAAQQVLAKVSDSGALGFNGPAPIRVLMELAPTTARVAITTVAATEQEAASKASQLRFLLHTVGALQRSKHPAAAELLSLVRTKSDGKAVVIEVVVARERWSALLRTWLEQTAAPAPVIRDGPGSDTRGGQVHSKTTLLKG